MKEETDKPVEKDGIVLRKRHIVIIVILLLLLLFGGIFVGMNWNKWFGEQGVQPVQTSQPDTSVDIDPNAGDWTGSKPEDKQPSSKGIKIPGYPSITIAADSKNHNGSAESGGQSLLLQIRDRSERY